MTAHVCRIPLCANSCYTDKRFVIIKNKNMKHRFLIATLLLLTAATIGAVVWYALRAEEAVAPVAVTDYTIPATWRTYTSTKYDFTFQYPAEYVIDTAHTTAEKVVILLGGNFAGRLAYEVTMQKNTGIALDNALQTEQEIATFVKYRPEDVDEETIMADGVRGKKYTLRNTSGYANTFAFFVTKGEVVRIAGNVMDEASRREFDMVLSSFCFAQTVDVQF